MFIEGTRDYLGKLATRIITAPNGQAFLIALQNWHWDVFHYCEEHHRHSNNDWWIRGAWDDALHDFEHYGVPHAETLTRSIAYAAILAAEESLNEIAGHANTMRTPGWQDEVIRKTTNCVLMTGFTIESADVTWDEALGKTR